jgi:predicted nucleic acid-binding protein
VIGLVDTSALIGVEGDPRDLDGFPSDVAVSVVTLAELELGVLLASDVQARQRRLSTLQLAGGLSPVPIDREVANEWARIIADLRQEGRRAAINDVWIAATAIRNEMSVITRDADFDAIRGLEIIRM